MQRSNNPYDFENGDQDDGAERRPKSFAIQETLAVLRAETDYEAILPAGAIYGLSDLSGENLAVLKEAWPALAVEQRRRTIRILSEASETNFDLDFEALAYLAFEDADPEVRAQAVDLAWYANSERMFHALMKLAADQIPSVRAAVLSGLGRFIRDGELEEFDQELAAQAQKLALARYDDLREDLDVRRRALEALSFCGHPRVPDMIHEAYYDDEPSMQASALFAMGCSYDQRWQKIVLKELDNPSPEIRFEAVRAAGELELADAVWRLSELAHEDDYEIQLMAVWSLGEIGTREAREALAGLAELAEELDDDELVIAVDEALDMALLLGDQFFPLFDFDEDFDSDDDLDELGEDEFDDSDDRPSLN